MQDTIYQEDKNISKSEMDKSFSYEI